MKLPLLVVHDKLGRECAIYDDDDELLTLAEVCKYINAHAAQPGAPKEDGEFVVRLEGSPADELVSIAHGLAYGDDFITPLNELKIVAHRKHTPLEVPHG